jgi:multisubunit Na+/H+ antiporter MnhB subunit
MLLKWAKILLSVGLATVTVGLMLHYLDITSGAFSIGLNFALMLWFTILESQVKPALKSRYFNPYPFEKQGKLYRILGVEWYRTVLVKSGWERVRQQQTPIKNSMHSFQTYERATRVAEIGHIFIGAVVLIVTGYVLFTYSVSNALWLILSNILLNFYPILLQRYTRPRLQRIIAKFRKADITDNPEQLKIV